MPGEKGTEEEVLVEVPGEVDEVVEESPVDETEGMAQEEIDRAVALGLIEKKAEVVKPEVKEVEKVSENDPKSFEEIEEAFNKNADEAHKKFKPNEKALYFKYKKEKLQRQSLAQKVAEFEASKELEAIKESASVKKLNAIKAALADPELTIEKLNAIIGEETKRDENLVSRDEIEAENKVKMSQQETLNQRVMLAEQIGISKYPNFKEIVELATEEAKNDKLVYEQLAKAFNDASMDEEQLVEKVVKIARMNEKFKDVVKIATPKEEEEVKRAIKNSQKPKSSASLGSSGKVMKREDDLTVEDVARFSTQQILALSKKTRERLMRDSLN